ncbi:hypothetical protein PFLUV_G00068490 [Perca fluviatilis]|uniref:Secreted protein n=1 Tax=Perca fluviatilis TaxID=8168 RepID=A0A6A5FGA0_PERFL|nr:hypothetical protein PFLUV_G00068490 [Perca fluviatilis]
MTPTPHTEVVLCFLFLASCVNCVISSSTERQQHDTHTAGRTRTTSTCRATELREHMKIRTDLLSPDLLSLYPTMHLCIQALSVHVACLTLSVQRGRCPR